MRAKKQSGRRKPTNLDTVAAQEERRGCVRTGKVEKGEMCQRFRPHQRICTSSSSSSSSSSFLFIAILFPSQSELIDAIVCDTAALRGGWAGVGWVSAKVTPIYYSTKCRERGRFGARLPRFLARLRRPKPPNDCPPRRSRGRKRRKGRTLSAK